MYLTYNGEAGQGMPAMPGKKGGKMKRVTLLLASMGLPVLEAAPIGQGIEQVCPPNDSDSRLPGSAFVPR